MSHPLCKVISLPSIDGAWRLRGRCVRVDLRVATGLLRSIDAVDGSSSFESVKGAVAARARLVAMLDGEGARLAKLLERHTPRADKAFGEAARKSEREGRKMR